MLYEPVSIVLLANACLLLYQPMSIVISANIYIVKMDNIYNKRFIIILVNIYCYIDKDLLLYRSISIVVSSKNFVPFNIYCDIGQYLIYRPISIIISLKIIVLCRSLSIVLSSNVYCYIGL
jgi:hypothetical protein